MTVFPRSNRCWAALRMCPGSLPQHDPRRARSTWLVRRRGRKRCRAQGTPLSLGQKPNQLWCTDYKGEFLLGNKRYCYPLIVTDHASRYLLLCEALESTCESLAFTAFERLFQERGLPHSIRSDNGVPFASPNSLFNLSKLSVWWLRLGICIERAIRSRTVGMQGGWFRSAGYFMSRAW